MWCARCVCGYNHRARPALDHTGPQPVAVFALAARAKTLRRRCSLPHSNAPLHACPHPCGSAPRPRPSCAAQAGRRRHRLLPSSAPRLKLGVSDSVHAAANLISSVTIDRCWKLFDMTRVVMTLAGRNGGIYFVVFHPCRVAARANGGIPFQHQRARSEEGNEEEVFSFTFLRKRHLATSATSGNLHTTIHA